MITGEHGYIRFSEADDALFLRQLYLDKPRRAALLDTRREPIMPTTRDIRDMLARKDAAQGLMYTVEDTAGVLKGWCGLRGINYEARYAELVLLFAAEEDYGSPLADETLDFLLGQAFKHFMLHKVLVLCLDTESALMQCLRRKDFACAGAQRQALFSSGVWNDLQMFTLAASDAGVSGIEMKAGVSIP
ncbi:MAG: hypothetical protein KAH38_00700 [Candidatus Hydrogenedentes bacterium]|nr:hypothetical protein [Candidatus Hydrogenedentota bacterium]